MRDKKCPKCSAKIRLVEEGQVGQKWAMRWYCEGCKINIHGDGKSRADCVAQFRRVKRRVAKQLQKEDGK